MKKTADDFIGVDADSEDTWVHQLVRVVLCKHATVTSTALLLLIHLPSSVCDDVAAPLFDDESRTCSLAAREVEREVGVSGEVELDAGFGVCLVDELEVVRRVRAAEDAAQLEVRLSTNHPNAALHVCPTQLTS